ncbi:SDR family NAD(P)-dependent oxidoreductase [Aestuariivivens sp. NBU2969]|uniref:SDR family NAD(P)-dependent oxidoreductase n=1 Tax=Aestuariivivens sp. NBU2969 TaxID=2873267 RepID=UPI001CC071EF|nr:SDR family oxidoreductase [Aestuariivivens sp. NBU2969]
MALQIDLKDKVALVTGISKGIGAGIASVLLEAGCYISGCARSEGNTYEYFNIEKKAESLGRPIHFMKTDVTNIGELKAMVQGTIDRFGTLDILISNAGVGVFEGLENCSEDKWNYNLDLNLNSHWRLAKLCKPYLEKSDVGNIVIIGSNHGFSTIPGCSPYSVTKTALRGLVQSMAIEWGPSIRANCIAPGFIDTEQNKKWFESFPDADAERTRTEKLHPVKRIGTPEEIGGFCTFLSSQYARFITGATYLVDGGRSAVMQDD